MSSSRSITLTHAENIHKMREVQTGIPEKPGVEVLIAEIDGCMVPIVETAAAIDNSEKIDRRKSRKVESVKAVRSSSQPPSKLAISSCIAPSKRVWEQTPKFMAWAMALHG